MADKDLHALWIDRGFAPRQPPNPDYPDGLDLDLRTDADKEHNKPSCEIKLKHPAVRVGYWLIRCQLCGLRTIVTTAGRVDDPRSVRVLCKPQ